MHGSVGKKQNIKVFRFSTFSYAFFRAHDTHVQCVHMLIMRVLAYTHALRTRERERGTKENLCEPMGGWHGLGRPGMVWCRV